MKQLLIAFCLALVTCSATADNITESAKVLAGLDSTSLNSSVIPIWQQHHQALVPQWKFLREQRLAKMQAWRNAELNTDNHCKTMLYPFSGPDFLNAYTLFPNCDTYMFFGLEHVGHMPDVGKLGKTQLATLLSDFRDAVGDVLERNYFITRQMSQQLHMSLLAGVTPIIGAEMVVLDLEIKSIEYDQGFTVLKIVFFNPQTRKQQTLYYYSLDATNVALHKHNPSFLNIINKMKPTYTLLKSASYLLHAPEFTDIRDTIVDVTTLLVQDDTGVPYQVLKQHNKWNIKLYGQYNRPVADFNYGYQPDLEYLYKVSPNVQPLSFPFGYHWKTGKSGLIVARKIK